MGGNEEEGLHADSLAAHDVLSQRSRIHAKLVRVDLLKPFQLAIILKCASQQWLT